MVLTGKYMLKKIGKDYTLIPVRDSSVSIDKIINLNETAVDIYKLIEKGLNKDEIVEELSKEYDVNKDVLMNDVDEFISLLISKEIVK